ncbi:hypothetical protein [Fimbriiglobus ruber]|uniref:Uncharacterized protein n=1 Tax=Fimbriiglobus ruber TaxID=1908690 RepID=A0A225E345_9BACT|nr:hypothetical protein [Fimbriiglobus ruber]OWK43909.1 hypothetical protein FRUB_03508 [Fimbriiglobus ruber]
MDPGSAVLQSQEVLPPPEPGSVYRVGLVGLGLSAAAAAIGGIAVATGHDEPGPQSTVRLVLVAGGALVAGSAISMSPGLWKAWAIAAVAVLLAAVIGIPQHWDSGRLLARAMTGVATLGSVLAAAPLTYRLIAVSGMVIYQFVGILCAVTWPEPTPWITNQVAHRVYTPYLAFVYLRNAYHFYSPEPGPASLLFVLLEYELDEVDPATGKKKTVHEWIILPDRHEHYKDPLGLTYYRRLSLTEMVSGTMQTAQSFEWLDVRQRRERAAVGLNGKERIPLAPFDTDPEFTQYKVPQPGVSRYLLPSYAHHLAVELSGPGRTVKSMKMYRIEHRVVPVSQFVLNDLDPFHPTLYRPYFVGEYAPDGTLIDPQDPMLFWLVPIVPKTTPAPPGDPNWKDYTDYLSLHAGYEFEWRRP